MNRRYGRWVGCIAVLLCIAFSMPAYGENYVSKDVPPDDVLLRMIQRHVQGLGPNPQIAIIGKFQENDKRYLVFYITTIPTKARVEPIMRLDTNIWIMGEGQIVQK